MFCKVAKRNNTIKTRKQRDYPWNNLADFLSGDQTPDGTLVGTNAKIIEDIIQTRFKQLWQGKTPANTTILDRVPNDGFHQSYVVDLDQYMDRMDDSAAIYDQCCYHKQAGNDEFFGTEEYIRYRMTCFVVRMELPEFKIGFTFMLRPFIFDHQTDELWHAGSMYVHTELNPRGWFYQMKYQISE
jgi:hypothetical protein